VNLAWVGEPVSTSRLAGIYELPVPYLNKQLQALARAGILESVPGPRGGFKLARDPANITLLDVVVAVEGPEEAFRCTQISKRGPAGDPDVDYRSSCRISLSMHRAELAWRRELAGRTIADVAADVAEHTPDVPGKTRAALVR
jgi:Rrf2 family protein